MEIREELIDNAKRLAGKDENFGFGSGGLYHSDIRSRRCIFLGGVFEGADYRGADGEDRARVARGAINGVGG
jgi:hypothetical protein